MKLNESQKGIIKIALFAWGCFIWLFISILAGSAIASFFKLDVIGSLIVVLGSMSAFSVLLLLYILRDAK